MLNTFGTLTPVLSLILLAASNAARAASEELYCLLEENGRPLASQSRPLREGQAVARLITDDEAYDLEGSLTSGSFVTALQDRRGAVRTAFTSGPVVVAGGGYRLRQGGLESRCRVQSEEGVPAITAPVEADDIPARMLCFLDQAIIRGGKSVSTSRLLRAVAPANLPGKPARIEREEGGVGYTAYFDFRDGARGLRLQIRDGRTGRETSFEGSANAFVTSVLFALTQGDRDGDATMLRLGCQLF